MLTWYILIGICYEISCAILYQEHYIKVLKKYWNKIKEETNINFDFIVPKTLYTTTIIMFWVLCWPLGIVVQIIDDLKYKKNKK